METNETKKCRKCGRELPLSEFHRNAAHADGLQSHCKECGKEYLRDRGRRAKMSKVYSNPELAKFTPRELMQELKSRGYTGELKYVQVINL